MTEQKEKQTVYQDGGRQWSHRYYASLDIPCQFYDLGLATVYANIPDEKNLFPLTEEQWNSRMQGNMLLEKAVIDGTFQDYQRPVKSMTIKDQAA